MIVFFVLLLPVERSTQLIGVDIYISMFFGGDFGGDWIYYRQLVILIVISFSFRALIL